MPMEDHPSNLPPPRPRRFGDQFYTNPEFFLHHEADDWQDAPLKTITEASMTGSIIDQTLQGAQLTAENRPELVEKGFPSQEELTTSVGAVVLNQISEMIPLLAGPVIGSHPEGTEAGLWSVKEARDAGLQGASEWWAGNVVGGGGGGHAPMEGLETGWNPIMPDPVHLRPGFNPDPHLTNTDTDLDGHLLNMLKYGDTRGGGSPQEFVDKMMAPISDIDMTPEDFTDDG